MAPPREPDPPTDAELLAYVTINGEIPLEDIGLVGWTIYTFNRGMGCYLAMALEDNRMAAQCNLYLRRIGREFKSIEEMRARRAERGGGEC